MTSRLADADPLGRIIPYLGGHPAVTAELGGPERVGPDNKPPYPRLLVSDAPGGSENLQAGLLGVPVRLEALGPLDGTLGKARLRRILYVALGVLAELPALPVGPDDVVITDVGSSVAGGYVPLADGRPRYVATVMVAAHAPYTP
ncbi:hypothetical protein ACQP10_38025 (plasmid) [Streptosporangium sandarakinum]|uniref:hypothetical protein n=1 Tax=Streptosporangium sandarakinum TaxID=1260955 RepID=UPI003D8C22B2